MSLDFWWGLAILPLSALALAGLLVGLHTILELTWRSNYINLKPGKYKNRALVAYIVARSDWVARLTFFYGFYVHIGRYAQDKKRETWGEMDALRAALHKISSDDEEARP
ncbi:hypothetical protein M3G04_02490 [Dietzia cinnamea]|uniref:hypothetical protein n=1 Tax=Dietzia cinnamea TaxID=321318 RepID=UPI00223AA644|nr:hypothetical protein [Dietzia cinnamea]MCT2299779.1 hypothetical protein [Dietzia cinnamea]